MDVTNHKDFPFYPDQAAIILGGPKSGKRCPLEGAVKTDLQLGKIDMHPAGEDDKPPLHVHKYEFAILWVKGLGDQLCYVLEGTTRETAMRTLVAVHRPGIIAG